MSGYRGQYHRARWTGNLSPAPEWSYSIATERPWDAGSEDGLHLVLQPTVLNLEFKTESVTWPCGDSADLTKGSAERQNRAVVR